MTAIIEAVQVKKDIKSSSNTSPTEILHGIDFSANTGEFVSILGPSGSGKTTLYVVFPVLPR